MQSTLQRIFLLLAFGLLPVVSWAQTDSLPERRELPVLTRVKTYLNKVYEVVKVFSQIDTTYVIPQKYNYTLMLENINTYETYELSDNKGQIITFAPKPSMKVGPYFGWRWLVLGYTIDLTHLHGGHNKQDFNISLYSNQVGVDLFYRKTGNDYRIRRFSLGDDINTSAMRHVAFDGLKASIKGFNLYYIFNHKKFSYPAAYSQSTVQRRSAGSALAGIGYTKHTLDVNWDKLDNLLNSRLQSADASSLIHQELRSTSISYTDFSISGGYTYNWVFAPYWLFNVSLSAALGHKTSTSDLQNESFLLKGFSLSNFNIDGVGRFGLVWNNTKWYAGASAIFHTYNYKKKQFHTNNTFGNINVYVGFNFMKK